MKRDTNPPMSPRKRPAYKLLVWLLSLSTRAGRALTRQQGWHHRSAPHRPAHTHGMNPVCFPVKAACQYASDLPAQLLNGDQKSLKR